MTQQIPPAQFYREFGKWLKVLSDYALSQADQQEATQAPEQEPASQEDLAAGQSGRARWLDENAPGPPAHWLELIEQEGLTDWLSSQDAHHAASSPPETPAEVPDSRLEAAPKPLPDPSRAETVRSPAESKQPRAVPDRSQTEGQAVPLAPRRTRPFQQAGPGISPPHSSGSSGSERSQGLGNERKPSEAQPEQTAKTAKKREKAAPRTVTGISTHPVTRLRLPSARAPAVESASADISQPPIERPPVRLGLRDEPLESQQHRPLETAAPKQSLTDNNFRAPSAEGLAQPQPGEKPPLRARMRLTRQPEGSDPVLRKPPAQPGEADEARNERREQPALPAALYPDRQAAPVHSTAPIEPQIAPEREPSRPEPAYPPHPAPAAQPGTRYPTRPASQPPDPTGETPTASSKPAPKAEPNYPSRPVYPPEPQHWPDSVRGHWPELPRREPRADGGNDHSRSSERRQRLDREQKGKPWNA